MKQRPFDGYLDNIRLHGTKTVGSAAGVLSAEELENLRCYDVSLCRAQAATWITSESAQFNGSLEEAHSAGNLNVYFCWDGSDKGTAGTGNWAQVAYLGNFAAGSFSTNVTGLTPGTSYTYRFFGTNSAGGYWSGPTSFTTTPTYSPGFVWSRTNDYNTTYNPGPDKVGNAVWSYEWVNTGTGLDSPDDTNRWYRKSRTLMPWSSSWDIWNSDGGGWHSGVSADNVYHFSYDSSKWGRIPLIRWINPVDAPIKVTGEGSYRVRWSGSSGNAPSKDADVVIAKLSGATPTLLYTNTLVKPTPDHSDEYSPVITLTPQTVELQPGDVIVYGIRGRAWETGESFWILDDSFQLRILRPAATLILIR